MDTLKEQFNAITKDIEDNEYDENEEIAVKQEMLKEIATNYEQNDLFKILSSPTFAYIPIEDRIVVMFNVEQYDIEKFEKAQKKRGLTEGKITDFKSMIFENIKKLLLIALDKLKDLVKEKFDEFAKKATEALAQFLKEQGLKLLEKIVDKIRGGEKPEEVEVKIDGEKQPLKCVLDKKDIKKIALLAEEIDAVYEETYEDVNKKVEKIKDGEEVEIEEESGEESNKKEKKDKKEKKEKKEKDVSEKSEESKKTESDESTDSEVIEVDVSEDSEEDEEESEDEEDSEKEDSDKEESEDESEEDSITDVEEEKKKEHKNKTNKGKKPAKKDDKKCNKKGNKKQDKKPRDDEEKQTFCFCFK